MARSRVKAARKEPRKAARKGPPKATKITQSAEVRRVKGKVRAAGRALREAAAATVDLVKAAAARSMLGGPGDTQRPARS